MPRYSIIKLLKTENIDKNFKATTEIQHLEGNNDWDHSRVPSETRGAEEPAHFASKS